jgi:hypothetical protein
LNCYFCRIPTLKIEKAEPVTLPSKIEIKKKYLDEISASKEYKDIQFADYDIEILCKLLKEQANLPSISPSMFSPNIISSFEEVNKAIVSGIQKNSDKSFDSLSIPTTDLITPVFDDGQILTHFELNPQLMKLAYLRDFRNNDTIKEGMRTMILLNRVLLNDKTLVSTNLGENNKFQQHTICTNDAVQTEFNDLIRNFFKRNLLKLKSFIDCVSLEDLHKQYNDSNDEDILYIEFSNFKVSESEPQNSL